MLRAENITVRFGDVTIVNNVSFDIHEKQWLMIVGPNGAGKSTLLHTLTCGVDFSGKITFDGRDIQLDKPPELAKKIGVLMQNHYVGYPFSVKEVVQLGRYAYTKGIFSSYSDEDEKIVADAMRMTGMHAICEQSVMSLSGGELQRTFLAQLLAQDPRLLILDEPSNHLDLLYQKQVFDMVARWSQRPGRAVISVVHDLSLAKAYGTHAMLLHKGELISSGNIDQVFSSFHLQRAYEMDVYSWMQSMLAQWQ